MTTETTTIAEAAGPGRGGRMSRQRKRDAVLRLLRGKDLETPFRFHGPRSDTSTLCLRKQASVLSGRRCNRAAIAGQDAHHFVDAST